MLMLNVILVGFIGAVFCEENTPISGEISRKKCREYQEAIPDNCQQEKLPYLVSVGYQRPNRNFTSIYGGSLISEQFVLLPAHCLFIPTRPLELAKIGEQIVPILEQIQHPQYKSPIISNDIGLIKLEKPSKFDCRLRPACLNTETGLENLEISGVDSGNRTISNRIRIEFVTQDDCNAFYTPATRLPDGIDFRTQICAKFVDLNDSIDRCRGNRGGPLQVRQTSRVYSIVGIPSFGKGCGNAIIVFTRISNLQVCYTMFIYFSVIVLISPIFTLQQTVNDRNFGEISKQKCSEFEQLIPENCPKIDHKTDKPSFPHMVLAGYEKPDGNTTWICNGSLISEQYVLMSAHCLSARILGAPKFIKINNQIVQIAEIIKHPLYRKSNYYNDIGLVKLEKPLKFDCNQRPACLNTDTNIEETGIVTVWAVVSQNIENLRQIRTEFTTQQTCNATYKEIVDRGLPNGIVNDTQICAIYRGLNGPDDICLNEGGGPLQIQRTPHLYAVIGVPSIGKRCVEIPVVYTRISAYIEWIEEIVWA